MERTINRIKSAIFDLQMTKNHAYLNANVKEALRVVVEDLEKASLELSMIPADLPADASNDVLCNCIERISWRAILLLLEEAYLDSENP